MVWGKIPMIYITIGLFGGSFKAGVPSLWYAYH